MRSNSRLLLVGVLVFIFPLLFVYITQSFFTTAHDNIDTAEKQRVGIIQDSLAIMLAAEAETGSTAGLSRLMQVYRAENQDISKIRVVEKVADKFIIKYADDDSLVGTDVVSEGLFRSLPLGVQDHSFIVETIIDGVRTWQVFRGVTVGQTELFIFTEHQFGLIDGVMSARQQQSYFGLTAIFIFLILLAYWLNKQVNWEQNHRQLELQLQERDMFSSMIAHEFRSPLTAIKGYASFLEDSKFLAVDELRYAMNIRKSAERLVVLVSDFLEVARLQSGKMRIEIKPADFRDILGNVVEDLRGLAEEKGLSMVFEKPVSEMVVNTDASRMTQVLTNLISNAIKYTDRGNVQIECNKAPGEVTVRIKDTGSGISAEDQQKLFAPFTRVGGVDDGNVAGSGLGMWITKQLVALLNGTIGIESIKGIGTHVVLTFRV